MQEGSKCRLDVLIILYAPLEQYPPSLNQVELMAKAGLRVGVMECYHPAFIPTTIEGLYPVKRFRPTRHTLHYKERAPSILFRLRRLLTYKRCLGETIATFRPRVVIAYDTFGFFLTGKLWSQNKAPRLIWHFHELPNFNRRYGVIIDAAHRFILRYSHKPDLLIFPDKNRSDHFIRLAKLSKPPLIVMNCPKVVQQLPLNALSPYLKAHKNNMNKIVYFHGWIGPSRGIETVIKSMEIWPKNSLFVLVGPIAESYKDALLVLAESIAVKKRLIFLDMVPIKKLFSLCIGANIGCSLVSDLNNLNWKFSAGAINKRFEYMALGIPQIANAGPGMSDLIEKYHCGLLVDPISPKAVGEAIHLLLKDESNRLQLGKNARKAHLCEFNYENQFSPILGKIKAWTKNDVMSLN